MANASLELRRLDPDRADARSNVVEARRRRDVGRHDDAFALVDVCVARFRADPDAEIRAHLADAVAARVHTFAARAGRTTTCSS